MGACPYICTFIYGVGHSDLVWFTTLREGHVPPLQAQTALHWACSSSQPCPLNPTTAGEACHRPYRVRSSAYWSGALAQEPTSVVGDGHARPATGLYQARRCCHQPSQSRIFGSADRRGQAWGPAPTRAIVSTATAGTTVCGSIGYGRGLAIGMAAEQQKMWPQGQEERRGC